MKRLPIAGVVAFIVVLALRLRPEAIDRASFFIAGGIVAVSVLLWVGYGVCKHLYRRIARGY